MTISNKSESHCPFKEDPGPPSTCFIVDAYKDNRGTLDSVWAGCWYKQPHKSTLDSTCLAVGTALKIFLRFPYMAACVTKPHLKIAAMKRGSTVPLFAASCAYSTL